MLNDPKMFRLRRCPRSAELDGVRKRVDKLLAKCVPKADEAARELLKPAGWTFLPLDIRVIALNETSYWHLPDDLMAHVERCEGVYWFDRNTRVYICSTTPSHELYFYENRAVLKDGTPDEVKDEIDGYMHQGTEEPVTCMDARDVEKFLDRHPLVGNQSSDWRHGLIGEVELEDVEEGPDGVEHVAQSRLLEDFVNETLHQGSPI